ncbi:MAG: hypothetical protein MJB14_01825 [Spirochaetes bacterium]|nr:hypothetical protein [Spirochaetota bacterium]
MFNKDGKRRSYPLHINISTTFLILILITIIFIVAFHYFSSTRVLLKLSTQLMEQANDKVLEKINHFLNPVGIFLDQTVQLIEDGYLDVTSQQDMEDYGFQLLKSYPQVEMINIGDQEGNFFMLKKFPDQSIGTKIIQVKKEVPVTWVYRHPDKQIKNVETISENQYDPRVRPWYIGAKKENQIFWSNLYAFFTDQQLGITVGKPIYLNQQLWGVYSVDISLRELCNFVKTLSYSHNSQAFIVNHQQQLIAYQDEEKIVKKVDNKIIPIDIHEINIPIVKETFIEYEKHEKDTFSFVFNNEKYLVKVTPYRHSKDAYWQIIYVVPENDFIGIIKKNNYFSAFIVFIICIVSVILIYLLSLSISQPIKKIAFEALRIKNLQLNTDFEINSAISEVNILTESIQSMKQGLRSFEKYVPSQLVRVLIRTGEEANIGGYKREATIFFSDIENFTRISEQVFPEELLIHISDYFEELTCIIQENQGTVDKYIGDAIMAFWGAPIWEEDHALHACLAALTCQKKLRSLNENWKKEGKIPFPTRFGIHTGNVVIGNIGSSDRLNYSAIGEDVNIANRLETTNKIYGTQILISESTYLLVNEQFLCRYLDSVAIKGINNPVKIYELLCSIDDEDYEQYVTLSDTFEKAMNLYLQDQMQEAKMVFSQILEQFPDDSPTKFYLERIEYTL